MNYYEMLMLIKPDASQEVLADIKKQVEDIVTKEFSGEIKAYDKWGKYLLAYTVEKCNYGIYILVRFGISEKLNEAIERLKNLCLVKYSTTIMRFNFSKLGTIYKEEYCKPDSLEDAPRRDKSDELWESKKRFKNKDNIISEESLNEEMTEADIEAVGVESTF